MPAITTARPGGRIKAGLLALLLAGGFAVSASCAPDEAPPPVPTQLPGDAVNVLQSVQVEMRPDGSIVAVESEAMAETADGAEPTLVRNQYSPAEVSQDLPIRLTTSYRTETSQGTNLADLAGYSGRVEISLTVRNLTLSPRKISYDAAGRSIQEEVLVGSPWTVFASTALPDVAPSSVVVSADDPAAATTNGVLAQLPDGSTSVQWASLLLSPSTMAGTTMTLVMDVDDMTVPEFELSAHPGVVGDPKASFLNGSTESETELLQRTVTLANGVHKVLGDVGKSIGELRKTLESSTTTFGADAVRGLQESNKQVGTSTQELIQQLTTLQTDVGSMLGESQSALADTLKQSVSSMQAMLGDASELQVSPAPQPQGCGAVPTTMSEGSTVAGLIGQMSAQLEAYAGAAEGCKEEVRTAILASIGPEDPTADDACPDDSGQAGAVPLTCALWDTRVNAQESLTKVFQQERDDLLASLSPKTLNEAKETQQELVTALDDVSSTAAALDSGVTEADFERLRAELESLSNTVAAADEWMTEQHERAVEQQDRIGQMASQNEEAAKSVCEALDVDNPPAALLDAYASLTDEPCLRADGTRVPVPDRDGDPMSAQLEQQESAWGTVATETDPDAPDAAGRVLLGELNDSIDLVEQRLDELIGTLDTNDKTREAARQALNDAIEAATTKNTELGQRLEAVEDSQEQFRNDVGDAFDQASAGAQQGLAQAIDPSIRQIHAQGQQSAAALDTSLDDTTAGIRGLSQALRTGGEQTLAQRSQALNEAGQATSDYVTQRLGSAGTYLSQGLGTSARDLEGARAPLMRDLQNALADLGTPQANGGGLLGSLATSSSAAATTDEQVALADSEATSSANVRVDDIGSIAKRQATLRAGLEAVAGLPLFQLKADPEVSHTTVYVIQLRAEPGQ